MWIWNKSYLINIFWFLNSVLISLCFLVWMLFLFLLHASSCSFLRLILIMIKTEFHYEFCHFFHLSKKEKMKKKSEHWFLKFIIKSCKWTKKLICSFSCDIVCVTWNVIQAQFEKKAKKCCRNWLIFNYNWKIILLSSALFFTSLNWDK